MANKNAKGQYDSTDKFLVSEFQSGNSDAGEIISKRYKEYISQLIRPYYLAGADNDDLIQEGMIGLIRAINSFESLRRRS